jgi:hypothetical protein
MIRSERKPGNAGFFILVLLATATVCHLFLAQNWNLYLTIFSLLPIAAAY